MGKNEGYLRIPVPVKDLLPLHFQGYHEAPPHYSLERSVPAGRLRVHPTPTTLIHIVVQDSLVPVRSIVVMREVSIDLPQQQVLPGQGKVWQIYAFLLGVCVGRV